PSGLVRVRDAETGEVRETVLGPTTAAAIRRKVEKIAVRIREICTTHAITYARAFGAGNLESIMERELPRQFALHNAFQIARSERAGIGNRVRRADLAYPHGYLFDLAPDRGGRRRAQHRLADFAGLRVAHAHQS